MQQHLLEFASDLFVDDQSLDGVQLEERRVLRLLPAPQVELEKTAHVVVPVILQLAHRYSVEQLDQVNKKVQLATGFVGGLLVALEHGKEHVVKVLGEVGRLVSKWFE